MGFVYALMAGLLFGLGLIEAGMTDPVKVKAFLDLAGSWDPSLALVMGAAVGVGVLAIALARGRARTWSGDAFEWPARKGIDARLLIGGALFGIGWGIGGFCPGPAVVALASGFEPALGFVLAMLVGMWLHDRVLAPWLARRVTFE